MDAYLAHQIAASENREESTALVPVTQSVGEVVTSRSWTKHPAFWFGVAAVAGVGVVSIVMRRTAVPALASPSRKREGRPTRRMRTALEDVDVDEVVRPTKSIFETLEDLSGLEEDDSEILAAAPAPAKPKKPRKSRAKKKEPLHAAV